MFSGKTTELMRRIKRYQVAKHKCLVIKYANDIRYDSEQLSTHDHQTLAAVTATTLTGLMEAAHNYSIIGIDEGQFFADTVSFAEAMANSGKVVIIAALDGTYQRQGFGSILQLVPLAESIVKLTAVCMRCYQDASFTKRITHETALEVIGGSEKYIAVCRACYHVDPITENSPSPLRSSNKSCIADSAEFVAKKLCLETSCPADSGNKENSCVAPAQ
ncbi:thymidine kinase, cytosolic isoform X2 [Hyalella azteca]|nr:thymidine kinase, cytosolic isoform X2 [Hyalella azteca]